MASTGLGQDEHRIYEALADRVPQVSTRSSKHNQQINPVSRYTGVTVDTNFTNISKLPSKYAPNAFYQTFTCILDLGYAKFGKLSGEADSEVDNTAVIEPVADCRVNLRHRTNILILSLS